MMPKILPLRHDLYKAPSDQIKFENKEQCFQFQVVSYKKVQGDLFWKLAKRNAVKRTRVRMQGEGKERAIDGLAWSTQHSLWLTALARVSQVVLGPKCPRDGR